MSKLSNSSQFEQSADGIKARFAAHTDQFSARTIEKRPDEPIVESMSDLTRQEISATLAASEARVAVVVETMRADAAELRAELREGNALVKAQGEVAKASAASFQAEADKFYADARSLLAESRTALTEIRLAGEQNRTAIMGMGYKVAAWVFGAIVAVGSLSLAVYKAVSAAVS